MKKESLYEQVDPNDTTVTVIEEGGVYDKFSLIMEDNRKLNDYCQQLNNALGQWKQRCQQLEEENQELSKAYANAVKLITSLNDQIMSQKVGGHYFDNRTNNSDQGKLSNNPTLFSPDSDYDSSDCSSPENSNNPILGEDEIVSSFFNNNL